MSWRLKHGRACVLRRVRVLSGRVVLQLQVYGGMKKGAALLLTQLHSWVMLIHWNVFVCLGTPSAAVRIHSQD